MTNMNRRISISKLIRIQIYKIRIIVAKYITIIDESVEFNSKLRK